MKVLVVDDDALVGDLSLFLLKDAGYDAELIPSSLNALPAIREKRPALVLLDILMPGVDGLTLCRQIKSDPALQAVKVAMVSAKSMVSERERAMRFGADAFIEKPYDTQTFAGKIKEILGAAARAPEAPAAPEPQARPAEQGPARFHVSIWGCRSGAPEAASTYGTETSCVSAEFDGKLFIFDAGTGLKGLGEKVMREGRYKDHWLFLSHFHPDHVSALASYPPAFAAVHKIFISGANDPEKSLQALVEEEFAKAASPLAAEFQLYEMLEDGYEVLPGVKVTSFYANHPTTTLGFGVEAGGRKLVYCPDGEIYGESATALQDYDEKLGGLCAGADLLIHDGRYTEEDYQAHKNEGHSSFLNALDFAAKHSVRKLVLFHQDARYDETALDRMAHAAAERIAEKGYSLECVVAREGMTLDV